MTSMKLKKKEDRTANIDQDLKIELSEEIITKDEKKTKDKETIEMTKMINIINLEIREEDEEGAVVKKVWIHIIKSKDMRVKEIMNQKDKEEGVILKRETIEDRVEALQEIIIIDPVEDIVKIEIIIEIVGIQDQDHHQEKNETIEYQNHLQ